MPIKTIAVPPNPAASRKARHAANSARPAAADDAIESTLVPLVRPPRPMRPQPEHRYRIGERLRMLNGGYSVARAAALCQVVSLLPYEGHGPMLYRVRSDAEAFERIVAEADLSRNDETP